MQVKKNSRLFDIGGRRVEVRGDAEGVVSHAGVALLSGLADRVGLTAALGDRPRARRQRASAHDPGEVLRDVAVALADGAECVSDLSVLRDQPALFGQVASHATVWRTLDRVADDEAGRRRRDRRCPQPGQSPRVGAGRRAATGRGNGGAGLRRHDRDRRVGQGRRGRHLQEELWAPVRHASGSVSA